MEMPGLKKLTEDKGQAVHQRLSQCQLGRDSESVRKNASRGGNKVTPREKFWSPCLWRGFLFGSRYPQTKWRYEQLQASKRLKSTTSSASSHKKPAVTRTSGQVMGELTIWPSS